VRDQPAGRLLARLRPTQRTFLGDVDRVDDGVGGRCFLVGGAIRDLLLDREPLDLDLIVEDDIEAVIRRLESSYPMNVERITPRFGTARCDVDGVGIVDLAQPRSEVYARPGALPDVSPGSLEHDLARRDFSINAIACRANGEGALLDPHEGVADIEARTLRALHDRSMLDDPTRMLRAARYGVRLGLRPSDALRQSMQQAIAAGVLFEISASRRSRELQLLWRGPRVIASAETLVQFGLWEPLFACEAPSEAELDALRLLAERWPDPESRWVAILALIPARRGATVRDAILRNYEFPRSLRSLLTSDPDRLERCLRGDELP